jgi:hypothetical protein
LLAAAGTGTVSSSRPANDRVAVRHGRPSRRIPGGTTDPGYEPGDVIVAVDLEGRSEPAAAARGPAPSSVLLLRSQRAEPSRAGSDDPERLVPEYVSLPRGAGAGLDLEAGMEWSRDHR